MSLLCLPATGTGIQPRNLGAAAAKPHLYFSRAKNSSGQAGENIPQPEWSWAAAGAPLAPFGTGNQHMFWFNLY